MSVFHVSPPPPCTVLGRWLSQKAFKQIVALMDSTTKGVQKLLKVYAMEKLREVANSLSRPGISSAFAFWQTDPYAVKAKRVAELAEGQTSILDQQRGAWNETSHSARAHDIWAL